MGNRKRVAIIGASDKPYRYSSRAFDLLAEGGYEPLPVNPSLTELKGARVYGRVEDIEGPVDTVTLYVSPERLAPLIGPIVALRPRRVIANPGAESEAMRGAAESAGIEYVEACTLVMLATGRF